MLEIALGLVKATLKAYWFVAYALIWSACLYILFYMMYLPTAEHVKPIHFQYRSDCERDLEAALCSFPSGSVPLHDGTKDIRDGIRILSRGQKYQIILEMEMPLSEKNQNLGMFLSEIKLIDEKNIPIQISSRSAMLPYRSYTIRMIRSIFYIVPFIFGFSSEKETLKVIVFDDFQELSYRPAVYANVTIYAKHVQLYSAQLRIKALFTGIRYYMYQWPVLFTVVTFSMILCLVLFIMIWRAIVRLINGEQNVSEINCTNVEDNDISENSETESAVEEVNIDNTNLNIRTTNLINRQHTDSRETTTLESRSPSNVDEDIDHEKAE